MRTAALTQGGGVRYGWKADVHSARLRPSNGAAVNAFSAHAVWAWRPCTASVGRH